MKQAYIWGCGYNGRAAYQYFSGRYEIIGYIDNNNALHGKVMLGKMIFSPEVLVDFNGIVILAMNNRPDKVIKQIREMRSVKEIILYSCNVDKVNIYGEGRPIEQVIIVYRGGLGNQMFQYALARKFEKMGKYVTADLSFYSKSNLCSFNLEQVFKDIKLTECNYLIYIKYKFGYFDIKTSLYKTKIYKEIDAFEEKKVCANEYVKKGEEGIYDGYWQSEKYFIDIRETLLNDFHFPLGEKKLQLISERMKHENAISVHIRRGDYLDEKVNGRYGNICTKEYYKKAIQMIKRKINHPIFYFFSDDIEWVKANIYIENGTYIKKNDFDDFHDWYDMYLMTICKHNVIANSSFSWWGAWLNQNETKMVIAPHKWINGCELPDICPQEWIRL